VAKVIFDISMSLDGFINAAGTRPDEPMGVGGEKLHEWFTAGDDRDREVLASGAASLGALIAGRRTYDASLPWWGADGPTGPARLPLFVVTHKAPDDVPEGSVYRFVTDGISPALSQAREAAGEKDVAVMGGADLAQQYLRAGLVDEIGIHLVPVLFGGGTRLVDHLDEHIHLEAIGTVPAGGATHLRYRVVSPSMVSWAEDVPAPPGPAVY
jgi:dihydrofolate reductase